MFETQRYIYAPVRLTHEWAEIWDYLLEWMTTDRIEESEGEGGED